MKITVTQEVDVSITPYCRNCFRKETDKNGTVFCGVYNRFLEMKHGEYVKCRECYDALYDEVTK